MYRIKFYQRAGFEEVSMPFQSVANGPSDIGYRI